MPTSAVPARVWVERAAAWVSISAGTLTEGAKLAHRTGVWTARGQHYVWACHFFHDAVRIGHSEAVLEDLPEVVKRPEGPLVGSIVEHALALNGGDLKGLMDVADRFSSMGAKLFAAEATAQAADLAAEQGQGLKSRQLATKARLRAEQCPGARTPALQTIGLPLTKRELEVARIAARGLTSKEISNRLSVSIRTVDNHLGSVYRKLGLDGRNELNRVFQV